MEGVGEMADRNPNAVAICGLYCGACFNWVDCHDQHDALVEPADTSYPVCEGCRTDNLLSPCANCKIRACAKERGLSTCADCGEMPCDRLQGIANLPRPHIAGIVSELLRIRNDGEQAWADEQRNRWTCPKCGSRMSWYMQTCDSCGSAVEGFDKTQWKG